MSSQGAVPYTDAIPVSMNVTLIFPPHWLSYQPYLSLPALAGHLKANGHSSVELIDANILATEWMLSPRFLAECSDRGHKAASRIDQSYNPSETQFAHILARTLPMAGMLVHEVDRAKEVLRDRERFYDPPAYARAMRVLKSAYRLISAAWWPLDISFNGCKLPYSPASSRQILAALNDPDSDFFSRFFQERVIPLLRNSRPGLVGLSIMCEDQVIPAFRLAGMLKKALPAVHIVAGGAFPTALVSAIRNCPQLFEVIDSFVANEGEDALLDLVLALEAGKPVHGLPNVLSCRDGEVIAGPMRHQNVNNLSTPDFADMPFELYLAPEFIAHLQTARGCYYNRCKFCALVATDLEGKYRPMPVDHVMRDVLTLRDRHGVRFFSFWDEAIRPVMIRRLSEEILRSGLDIRWSCHARLEPTLTRDLCQLAARAGCLEISFGLESGCPRVLEAMNKGTKVEVIEEVFANCAGAGIATNLYLIIGYPTESLEEAHETLAFILRNRRHITHVIFSVFSLQRNSLLMRELVAHGIEMRDEPDNDLCISYPYQINCPAALGPEEASRLSLEFTSRAEEVGLASPNSKGGAHFLLFLNRGIDPVGIPAEPAGARVSLDAPIAANPDVMIFYGHASSGEVWALDRRTWRLFLLSRDVLKVLQLADQAVNGEELLERLAPSASESLDRREQYRSCLRSLLRQGLLATSCAVPTMERSEKGGA